MAIKHMFEPIHGLPIWSSHTCVGFCDRLDYFQFLISSLLNVCGPFLWLCSNSHCRRCELPSFDVGLGSGTCFDRWNVGVKGRVPFPGRGHKKQYIFPLLSYSPVIHQEESMPNSSCCSTMAPVWDTCERSGLNMQPRATPSWDLPNPSPPTEREGEKHLCGLFATEHYCTSSYLTEVHFTGEDKEYREWENCVPKCNKAQQPNLGFLFSRLCFS